jgi:glycine/D-amino acid oxidase-like deaminating enzyme
MQPGEPHNSVKVAYHYVDPRQDYSCTPDTINRDILPEEVESLRKMLCDRLPGLAQGEVALSATCMYTMTPDEHLYVHSTGGYIIYNIIIYILLYINNIYIIIMTIELICSHA